MNICLKFIVDVVSMIVFVAALVAAYLIYKKHEKERSSARLKIAMLEYNYDNIYKKYLDSRKATHDIKNHLIILYHYINENENRKALEYIESIKGYINCPDKCILSGVRAVDILLNYKLMEAQKNKIEAKYYIDMLADKKIAIQDCDFCALLANLLDNMIEACQWVREEKRWAFVSVRHISGMVVIRVSNSICMPPIPENGKLLTTKKNRNRHGVGLSIVKGIVAKYKGVMEYNYDDNQFSVHLTLFC